MEQEAVEDMRSYENSNSRSISHEHWFPGDHHLFETYHSKTEAVSLGNISLRQNVKLFLRIFGEVGRVCGGARDCIGVCGNSRY